MKDCIVGALVGVALGAAFAVVFAYSIPPSPSWCRAHPEQVDCRR